jgi:hypothetical protein
MTDFFLALVDSGADRSTFPISMAPRLGIDVNDSSQCRSTKLSGIVATGVAYPCLVEVEVESQRIQMDANFAAVSVSCLGRMDVFWHSRFCFDERAEELLVEPY